MVSVNKSVKADVEESGIVGVGLNGNPLQIANQCSSYGTASPGGLTLCLSSLNTANNSVTNATATLLQDNNPNGNGSFFAKGRLNFSLPLNAVNINAHHFITLIDSQNALTQSTWGYRPPASVNDTWIGTDVPSGVGLYELHPCDWGRCAYELAGAADIEAKDIRSAGENNGGKQFHSGGRLPALTDEDVQP